MTPAASSRDGPRRVDPDATLLTPAERGLPVIIFSAPFVIGPVSGLARWAGSALSPRSHRFCRQYLSALSRHFRSGWCNVVDSVVFPAPVSSRRHLELARARVLRLRMRAFSRSPEHCCSYCAKRAVRSVHPRLLVRRSSARCRATGRGASRSTVSHSRERSPAIVIVSAYVRAGTGMHACC